MSTTLPFPVAALLRRHRNAKSGKERHDSAYWAWEASVRLAVAARPPESAELRGRLARASAGDWFAALDGQDRVLVDPALLALYAHCTEALGSSSRPKGVKLGELLSKLAGYRNATIGHGGMREPSYYEQGGRALAEGLQAAWEQGLFLPAQSQLLHCDEVQRTSDGGWRARLYDLAGESPVVLDPSGTALQQELLPKRMYARHQGRWVDLYPWTLFLLEEESFLLFHGLARSPSYIDLVSGEHRRAQELELLYPQLVPDVRALFSTSAQGAAARADAAAVRPGDGEVFGDYTLLGKLGEGGMGVVYLARQESLGRLVALKQLRVVAGTDPVAEARFRREVLALSRCDHPNVVKIHTYGRVGDTLYFAMEYIEGADLGAVAGVIKESDDVDTAVKSASESRAKERTLAEKALPQVAARMPKPRAGRDRARALAELFAGAADGLAHLHERGILHRDIKPSNIMVTWPEPRAVVMDLGLAKLSDASMQLSSDHTRILGTLRYMAPEQLQRERIKVDTRADVYGLGATMYELLADRAFRDAQTEEQLMRQVLVEDSAPALHKVSRSVPRTLSKIVAGATQRDASRRYASAAALAEDLRAFLSDQPIRYEPPGPAELLRLWVARHKALSATAAASLVTLASLSTAFVVKLDSERQRAEDGERQAKEANSRLSETVGQLESRNEQLREQAREKKLRGLAPELARFRAQCRTTEGLEQLGKPAWQWWLDEADRLVDGREEDLAKGIEWSPGLKDVRARLVDLREQALPWSEFERIEAVKAHSAQHEIREIEREREESLHGRSIQLDAAKAHRREHTNWIQYVEYRLGLRSLPSDSDVRAKYTENLNETDCSKLDMAARKIIIQSDEFPDLESLVLAYLLARRGVELSPTADSWPLRETLAWSLSLIGREAEAIAMMETAIAHAGGNAEEVRAQQARMQADLAEWKDKSREEKAAALEQLRMELPAKESAEQSIASKIAALDLEYAERIASLMRLAESAPRTSWRFERSEDELWLAQLSELESELTWLESMRVAADDSNRSERALRLWSEAIEAIARSPKYAGQRWPSGERLTPQAGLLPLGENPATGLWEFVHLQSGTEPVLGADGRVQRSPEGHLTLTPETGMVLVLLPGARVPESDSLSQYQQEWITSLDLAPFFLSKYELTQEQWNRLSPLHNYLEWGNDMTPARAISWDDINLMWRRELGWCDFPSEMQWEYGCRAGTTSTWWAGNEAKDLQGAENVEESDGELPVGTLRANAFGLHDVHGNVTEWCGDTFYALVPPRTGDGLRDEGVVEGDYAGRVSRGGSCAGTTEYSTSASRLENDRSYPYRFTGLRPLRRITP